MELPNFEIGILFRRLPGTRMQPDLTMYRKGTRETAHATDTARKNAQREKRTSGSDAHPDLFSCPTTHPLAQGISLQAFSRVLALPQDQMARQNAILFTKSARLYSKFRADGATPPSKYPKKYPSG